MFVCALVYMAALFAVAAAGDTRAVAQRLKPSLGWVYGLSLAVYCTSWTFYGAVGTAARDGWTYLPIYLGPILVFLFGQPLLRRMIELTKSEKITSIADFLAARYGKSSRMAAMATACAALAVLPYIALQLKSVGLSYGALVGGGESAQTVFFVALALAAFSILFGARRIDVAQPNPGLALAIAMESAVKLVALVAVAVFAWSLLDGGFSDGFSGPVETADLALSESPPFSFWTILLLSAFAAVCLPRQFHVLAVEADKPERLGLGAPIFVLYLVAIAICALPIAIAGAALLPEGVSHDLYVLALPLEADRPGLALLAFLGGFAAATGMVIVASVALSTMITNDWFAPLAMRLGGVRLAGGQGETVGIALRTVRRLVIVAILMLAYAVYRVAGETGPLAEIGLVSFAMAAQLGPALIAALVWRGAHRNGALLGLALGVGVCAYTLLLPLLTGFHLAEGSLGVVFGPGGVLHPHGLLGMVGFDPLTHGVVWSLGLNTLALLLGSLSARAGYLDQAQADRFSRREAGPDGGAIALPARATIGDLEALATRFVGVDPVRRAFDRLSQDRAADLRAEAPADAGVARSVERLLAGALGASSARLVLANALTDKSFSLDDVARLLDGASQELQFSRELLQAALENISQGVSVVDRDLRLVAWNRQYIRLFNYPAGFIQVGRPIADVIRFNAMRGWCGPGGVEAHVEKRLEHLKSGRSHSFERRRPNGLVLKSSGEPIPGGGYVMSFSDITRDKRREEELEAARADLERRVQERTRELLQANIALDAARRSADAANASKTRFLAAASHDLLQPLNAARLFLAALERQGGDLSPQQQLLASNVDRAIGSADRLIRALLDVSRLDQQGVKPKIEPVRLGDLLEELAVEASARAEAQGLAFHWVDCGLTIDTDRALLRSVIQNLVSNAIRYTDKGRVLVGVRRRGEGLRIEVWDTGRGVAPADQPDLFDEFRRACDVDATGERGFGLGLAIVKRIGMILGGEPGLRSEPGRGSVFFFDLPRCKPRREVQKRAPASRRRRLRGVGALAGLKVLCVDDEAQARAGMRALLESWGCVVLTAENPAAAVEAWREFGGADVALVDHQLAGDETGFHVLRALNAEAGYPIAAALVSADITSTAKDAATRGGWAFIPKPVVAEDLRAFLRAAQTEEAAAQ